VARSRPSSSPGIYKMHTMSKLTGVSPVLLRAWEARYGFLEPRRAPKGHRLYTDDDLAILRHVKQLLETGRSVGEVALLGREALLEQARSAAPSDPGPLAETSSSRPPRADLEVPLAQLRDRLVRSAVDLDEEAAVDAIDAAFARVTPETALGDVIVPAAREVGERWATGRCSVAGEHLVSGLVEERVRRLLDAARTRAAGPLTVCACLPDELHELGSLVVAYHLVRLGHRVAVLGANLPIEELDRACDRLRPVAVCLSVSRDSVLETHLPELVSFVKRRRDRTAVFVGGDGVRGDVPELAKAGATVWRRDRGLAELSAAIARRERAAVGRRRP